MLLSGTCACTSTCLHVKCLERLLNSKKSRSQPLRLRLQCTMKCMQSYNAPFSFYVLSEYKPDVIADQLLSSYFVAKHGGLLILLVLSY